MTNPSFNDSLLKLRYQYRLAKKDEPNYLTRFHAGQRLVAEHPARFKVVCCGRKWGKTNEGAALIARDMKRGKWLASLAPTYKYTVAIFDELLRLMPSDAQVNRSEMSVRLPNGGKYRAWSMDTTAADNVRPFEYDGMVIDEAAFIPDLMHKWSEILLPTLAVRRGWAAFLSTPKGFNDFYKLYEMGQDSAYPDWQSWRFATLDPDYGTPYVQPEEIEMQRTFMTDDEFAQEYQAQFRHTSGNAVFRLKDDTLYDPVEVAPVEDDIHVAGLDWGQSPEKSAMSIVNATKYREVALHYWKELPMDAILDNIVNLVKKWNVRLLMPESNSIGKYPIERLHTLLHEQKHEWGSDKHGTLEPVINPFHTSNISKHQVVTQLQMGFIEGFRLVNDATGTNELYAFQTGQTATGQYTYSHPPGGQDDTVLARLLAHHACYRFKGF